MYKILIKYNEDYGLWKVYGTESTTSSVSGTNTEFSEYGTDDVCELKEEVLKLDSIYGHSNIKVIKDVTTNYKVEFTDEPVCDRESCMGKKV